MIPPLTTHTDTEKPRMYSFLHGGHNTVLIDTPGFGDGYRTDEEVLQDIASCMQFTYEHGMKLTGIIYLHRITDPIMTHSAMRDLTMFRKLCGKGPLKNVVLTTSFWDGVNPAEGEARELKLRDMPELWNDMIAEGSQMARFQNSRDSALGIIATLTGREKVTLDIQREMMDEGKT